MPIFKVSIFKTSFLTGNPWIFLWRAAAKNTPSREPSDSLLNMENANAILFHMFFWLHKNFLMFFSKKRINNNISTYNTTGLRGNVTPYIAMPWQEVARYRFSGESPQNFSMPTSRDQIFFPNKQLSWVENLVLFTGKSRADLRKFKLTMHISLLVEVQPHPKHKQNVVFLWPKRPKVTASALWFMMYGSTSGQLRTHLYGKNNHHWNLI